MRAIKAWLKEFRVLFLLFVALPVVLGSAIAYAFAPQAFSLYYFALSIIAMLSLHSGTVILNDYFDFKSGTDVINRERTQYSGGSGLLPEKILSPRQVAAAGLLCFGLCIVIGLYIVFTRSFYLLAIGAVGVVIGFFYTAPPFKLAYRGTGELARLAMTPLIVLGAFLVQVPPETFSLDLWPICVALASSIPVALINTSALYIFEFPDYEADSASGKRNLVVRLGRKNAAYVFILLNVLTFLSLLIFILLGLIPILAGIAFILIPLSALACRGLLRNYDRPQSLIPYMKATSDAYIILTIALIVAFLV